MDISGSVISLDGAYDSKKNRKMIFNAGGVPNINEINATKRTRNEEEKGYLIRLYSKSGSEQ
jgi:hypothetical protein